MGDIVSHVFYSIFILILTFLIVNNYKGMTAIMQQGGQSLSSVSYTLQGRGTKPPTGY